MAASDYVPISFKNRLHLAGRPQMGSRPRWLAGVTFNSAITISQAGQLQRRSSFGVPEELKPGQWLWKTCSVALRSLFGYAKRGCAIGIGKACMFGHLGFLSLTCGADRFAAY
jgi:hypothetical protein